MTRRENAINKKRKNMRTSTNQIIDGRLINGYDYKNQAWVINGKFERCDHPKNMNCNCYGRIHEGENTKEAELIAH